MLAFLGWNPGTEEEFFSLEALTEVFSLERVHKAGAKFDPEKTKWFQHHYLQEMDERLLTGRFQALLQQKGVSGTLDTQKIVSLLKERATFVEDLWEQGSFFYEAPQSYDEKAAQKAFKSDTKEILQQVKNLTERTDTFTSEALSETIKGWITQQEMGFGKVMMPLRLALVGEMKGPDVFDIMALLGKKESLQRIERTIQHLS
tara:strand:- start:168 stop:776 length:609 start_codon:yes stop_codon:yes gene_type:complete